MHTFELVGNSDRSAVSPHSDRHSAEPYAVHRWDGVPGWRWQCLGLGIASLAWFLLRTGSNPRRIVYPCQQAAAAASLGLVEHLIYLVASTALFRCIHKHGIVARVTLPTMFLECLGLLRGCAPLSLTRDPANPKLPSWTNPSAVSDVFAVHNVPVPRYSLAGGSIPPGVPPAKALGDAGIDALIDLMDSHGTYLYRTAAQQAGIIGSNDVVIIKINDQWNGDASRARTHTNNDVLKGLIHHIVQHPEGFSGVVVVAENTQWTDPNWDSADHNNAEDAHQSYQDVVHAFVSQGYDVCISDWRELNGTFVAEYSEGDGRDGYVLVDDPGEPGTDQLSYPKFRLTCGSLEFDVSMRYGLWDGATYDSTRLKLINMPMLKRHGWAGATIAVKNYIGFLTTSDVERRFGSSDEMHGFFWGYKGHHVDYGLLGRQMARIRRADLNIVDAIWAATASNNEGCPNDCVRRDILLASSDPFALDYYASVNVLAPLQPSRSLRNVARSIIRGSSNNDASAAHPDSKFRNFLLCNENRLRLEGVADIIDLDSSYTQAQEEAQFNVYVADASTKRD